MSSPLARARSRRATPVRLGLLALTAAVLGALVAPVSAPAAPGDSVAAASINFAETDTGNGLSGAFTSSISADGTRVAFESTASDLSPLDTDSEGDVFVRDLVTGLTTLVSVNTAGTASGNNASSVPVISADGTRVAFLSLASDLVTGFVDGNGAGADLFVRGLDTGTTTLVSINDAGTASGNGDSFFAAISANGARMVFESDASDLVATDTNGTTDVFVSPAGAEPPPPADDDDDDDDDADDDDGDYDTYDDDPGDTAFDFDSPFDNAGDPAGQNPGGSGGDQLSVAGDQLATSNGPGSTSDPGATEGILPAALDMLPRTGLGGGLTLAAGLFLAAGGFATVLGRRRQTGES